MYLLKNYRSDYNINIEQIMDTFTYKILSLANKRIDFTLMCIFLFFMIFRDFKNASIYYIIVFKTMGKAKTKLRKNGHSDII